MRQNYKLVISYDGSRYLGWEHQPGTELTIQGKLEAVLNRMTGLSEGEGVTVIGAGRTDAGVHARAMTANVFLDTALSEKEIREYMNRYLPEDISVNECRKCSERFHARYKATGKTYRYTFYTGEQKPVFERKYVTVLEKKPDAEAMRAAAQHLVGEYDFRSFCGNSHMKKSSVRRIDRIEITDKGPYLRIYFHGSGFLQNQVRIMVGMLLEVGFGKRSAAELPEILEARDRKRAGYTAEPQGLCLMKVDYGGGQSEEKIF